MKENRRDKWGQSKYSGGSVTAAGSAVAAESAGSSGGGVDPRTLRYSGGEDVLGSARAIETKRAAEGPISGPSVRSGPPKRTGGGGGDRY